MQVTVENCTSLCVNPLQKSVKKQILKDYPECSSEELCKHMYEQLKKFTVNEQFFNYESLKNYLGGNRWFFLCPKCKNRVSKLFLPPEAAKKENKYLCKTCHRLKNQSAIQGQNKIYRKVTKPLKRMKDIEDKITKGHLRPEKVQELLDDYERLEINLKKSPEYRLYKFKKKHDLL